MSSVAENDGFETVKHRQASNANNNNHPASQALTAASINSKLAPSHSVQFQRRRSNLNPTGLSNAGRPRASVAGTARSNVYAARAKPGSIYEESCIPVADRDPALMAAQNSKGVKIPKDKYRPGMLIRAAMHEPDLNQGGASSSNITTATVADTYRTDTRLGPIHTKVRKAIVIALYQDHYLVVPLFTHNGNGLLNKVRPEEFISVRDHRFHGDFKNLSKHGVLDTEHLNAGVKPLHEKSTAHITYLISRKYDLLVVHEGHLTAEATHQLVKLFDMYAPKTTARV